MYNILIVDDDTINRKLLKTIIKKLNSNYNPIEAKDGLEAYNIIKKNNIDIIFLDIFMPIMDGIDLLKLLKKKESEYTNIPVAILTTDDTKKTEAKHLGACDFLTKPISKSKIKNILDSNLT